MWKKEIEELMRENEEFMMHSEVLMRKLINTDNSGHYVRPRRQNVRAHALRSPQQLFCDFFIPQPNFV